MPNEQCVGCGSELLEIDKDPNGDENATCKRCLAEEDHDFDQYPAAVFNRSGERIDDQPVWKPSSAKPVSKPKRIMVEVEVLKSWSKTCEEALYSSGACGTIEISNTINAMIKAAEDRNGKRKKR